MASADCENIAPSGTLSSGVNSPVSKKLRTHSDHVLDAAPVKQIIIYEKAAVDSFIAHIKKSLDKAENEILYWATLYEESQKELFELKEKFKQVEHKDEVDYLDPDAIAPRSNRPSLETRNTTSSSDGLKSTSSTILGGGPQRWMSSFMFKDVMKSAVSRVVGSSSHNMPSDDYGQNN